MSNSEKVLLAKIVQHMKQRHQKKENFPISLEELLYDLKQEETPRKIKDLLENEYLVDNAKIEVRSEDGVKKYLYKPIYNLKKGDDLLNLLKEQQNKSIGGILLDEIQESLPHADVIIKKLEERKEIVVLPGRNRKKVVYINSNEDRLDLEEDLVKHWRNVTVDGLDENKIDDYLEKKNITSMKGSNIDKEAEFLKTKKPQRKARAFKKHNEHLSGVLNDYNPELSVAAKKTS